MQEHAIAKAYAERERERERESKILLHEHVIFLITHDLDTSHKYTEI